MNPLEPFENMTISNLIKLKEEYIRLEKENKILKIKYPQKAKSLEKEDCDLDKLLEDL